MMDDFDKELKMLAKKSNIKEPYKLRENVNYTCKKIKRKNSRVLKVAAMIALIIGVSSFTPIKTLNVSAAIKSAFSYFQEKTDSMFKGDKEVIEKFNKNIGVSDYNNGIKVTLNNILIDDNYILGYYTIYSDKKIEYSERKDENKVFGNFFATPWIKYKADNKDLIISDNRECEGYFKGENQFNFVVRENISENKLPSKFKLDIKIQEIFGVKGEWNLKTSIDKSDIEKETRVKSYKVGIKGKLDFGNNLEEVEIEKVVLSPLGSQLVMKNVDKFNPEIKGDFLLIDDKGNYLDILNDNSLNSYEFLKNDNDIKYIDIVSVLNDNIKNNYTNIMCDLNKEKITLQANDKGKIIVEDIKFYKDRVTIKYKKEGYVNFSKEFNFYDEHGNKIEFGKGGTEFSVDRSNNIYTTTYISYDDKIDFSKYKKIGALIEKNISFNNESKIRVPINQ